MEVGEYVRTVKGKIGKVIKIWDFEGIRKQTLYLIDWGGKASYISKIKNLKHSFKLANLVEVGDFINGYKIGKIDEINGFRTLVHIAYYERSNLYFQNEEIKDFVTKEQFDNIKYKVELDKGE